MGKSNWSPSHRSCTSLCWVNSKSLKRRLLPTYFGNMSGIEPLVFLLVFAIVFAVLCQYRHILSLIRYRLDVKTPEEEVDVSSRPKIERTCPVCGSVMEEGYLVGPSGIYWSKHPPPILHRLPIFSRPDFRTDPAFSFGSPFGTTPLFRAYRCWKCGIIYVDTGSEEY